MSMSDFRKDDDVVIEASQDEDLWDNPPPGDYPIPVGLSASEKALFAKLADCTAFYAYAYGHGIAPESMVSHWELLKVLALLPSTDEEMRSLLGSSQHDEFTRTLVDEVRVHLALPSIREERPPYTDEDFEREWGHLPAPQRGP